MGYPLKGSGPARSFHKIPVTISSHFVKVVKIKRDPGEEKIRGQPGDSLKIPCTISSHFVKVVKINKDPGEEQIRGQPGDF